MKKELFKIVNYLNANKIEREQKTTEEIETIVERVVIDYNTNNYDFSGLMNITLNQMGKKRKVKVYESFSTEEILCIYIKRLIDRKIRVRYPNRNVFVHAMFDVLASLKDMTDYTICKFDFKDFFNSVSSEYVYEKYLSNVSFERLHKDLIKEFCQKSKYAYAGLNTSNAICEIIAKDFDKKIELAFFNRGLIYYKRYIDDSILVFNSYISETDCLDIINNVIADVFHDNSYDSCAKCKVKINNSKTKYISKRDLITSGLPEEFDFLGYLFVVNVDPAKPKKTHFKYGITNEKIAKYSKRIEKIIIDYKENPDVNLELLRHRIKAFSTRTVYLTTRYNQKIWKAKGFISNYSELRNRLDQLNADTKNFLENGILNSFVQLGVDLPYFLKGRPSESTYSLYNNLKKNRTLLLVEQIGVDYESLKKECKKIGIENVDRREYDSLVREYLIKVKVGH